jgi:hypothetical protein
MSSAEKHLGKALLLRDKGCVATGQLDDIVPAYIIPLDHSELLTKEQLHSPANGIMLHRSLKDDYDHQYWMFDAQGKITILFQHWRHKSFVTQLKLNQGPEGPSPEFIALHNELALQMVRHRCPHCWKCVGQSNIETHIAKTCETG